MLGFKPRHGSHAGAYPRGFGSGERAVLTMWLRTQESKDVATRLSSLPLSWPGGLK